MARHKELFSQRLESSSATNDECMPNYVSFFNLGQIPPHPPRKTKGRLHVADLFLLWFGAAFPDDRIKIKSSSTVMRRASSSRHWTEGQLQPATRGQRRRRNSSFTMLVRTKAFSSHRYYLNENKHKSTSCTTSSVFQIIGKFDKVQNLFCIETKAHPKYYDLC